MHWRQCQGTLAPDRPAEKTNTDLRFSTKKTAELARSKSKTSGTSSKSDSKRLIQFVNKLSVNQISTLLSTIMVAEHSCVQIVVCASPGPISKGPLAVPAHVKCPQENSNKLPIKSQSTAQKQARDYASLKKP